jgi:hypothetical protein
LDLSQVATLVDLSEGTLERWADARQLKGLKSSAGWTFLKRDVDAFIESRRHHPGFLRTRLDDAHLGDPWLLRPKRGGQVELAAGSDGRPLDASAFWQGGSLRCAADFRGPLDAPPVQSRPRSRLRHLQRRFSKEMAKCRLSGLCDEIDMKIIDALLQLERPSLRDIGRRAGCSHETVANRIKRFAHRAPYFWNLWRYKNRVRPC